MSDDSEKKYELVFEGPKDDSAETMRRLKGSFVADLDFSVEEVQRFLSEAPLTIKRASSKDELSVLCKTLDQAGARVLLVQRGVPIEVEAEHEYTLDFETEIEDRKPKVYSLNLEDDVQESLAQLVKSIAPEEETFEKTEAAPTPAQDASPFDLSFDDESPAPVAAALAPASKQSFDVSDNTDLGLSFDLDPSPEIKVAPQKTPAPTPPAKEQSSDLGFELTIAPEEENLTPHRSQILSQPESEDVNLNIAPEEEVLPTPKVQSKPSVAPQVSSTPPAKAAKAEDRSSLDIAMDEPPIPPPEKPAVTPKPPKIETKAGKLPTPQVLSAATVDTKTVAEVIEPEDQDELPEKTAKKGKAKKSGALASDYVIPILGGVTVLTAINFFYFSANHSDVDPELLARLAQKASAKIASEHEAEKLTAPQEFVPIEGESSSDVAVLGYYFEILEGKVSSAMFSVNPKPPAPLSASQIAAGETQPAWLRKLMLELPSLSLPTSGEFSQEREVKFYIEEGGKPLRKPGKGKVSGIIDQANGKISVKIVAATNDLALDQVKPGINLTKLGKGTFSISTSAEWTSDVTALKSVSK